MQFEGHQESNTWMRSHIGTQGFGIQFMSHYSAFSDAIKRNSRFRFLGTRWNYADPRVCGTLGSRCFFKSFVSDSEGIPSESDKIFTVFLPPIVPYSIGSDVVYERMSSLLKPPPWYSGSSRQWEGDVSALLFCPKDEIIRECNILRESWRWRESSKMIGLHVRKGDRTELGNIPLKEYVDAVVEVYETSDYGIHGVFVASDERGLISDIFKLIESSNSNIKVFSVQLQSLSENIMDYKTKTVSPHNATISMLMDFHLLSECNYIVGSQRSTFVWGATRIAIGKRKEIGCPTWIGPKGNNYGGVFAMEYDEGSSEKNKFKYFSIFTSTGIMLYSNHENPNHFHEFGGIIFASSHYLRQFPLSMRAGNVLFVFEVVKDVIYSVVSNQMESEPFLRRQLHMLHTYILMRLGKDFFKAVTSLQVVSVGALESAIDPYVKYTGELALENQGFLVQSVELLEVDENVRNTLAAHVKKCFEENAHVSHAYLTLKTKLLCSYIRKGFKAPELVDMQLILIAMKAELDKVRGKIRQNVEKAFEEKIDSSVESPVPIPENSFPEDFFTPGTSPPIDPDRSADIEITDSMLSETAVESPTNHTPRSMNIQMLRRLKKDLKKASVVVPVTLRDGETYKRYWIFAKEYTLKDVDDLYLVLLSPMRKGRIRDENKEKENVKRNVRMQRIENKKVLDNYLRKGPILNEDLFTMWSHVVDHAGLIHFIFVDRRRSEVYAPSIMPLHGRYYDPLILDMDSKAGNSARDSVLSLRKRIWRCVNIAHNFQTFGYTMYLARDGDVQYFYRLCVEDENGREFPFNHPFHPSHPHRLPLHHLPVKCERYSNVIEKVFPTYKALLVYEIYAIFVGYMPIESIGECVSNLADELKQKISLKKVKRR